MPKPQRRLLVIGLLTIDALAIAAAVIVAVRLTWAQRGAAGGAAPVLLLLGTAIPMAIALFALNRVYVLDELFEGPLEYGRIVYGCTLTALSLSVLGFWQRDLSGAALSPRRFIVLAWLFSVIAVGVGRFMARRVVRVLRRKGYLIARTLVVGLGTPGISIAHHFADQKDAGIQIVGFIDDFLSPGTPVTDGLKVLGPPSALARIIDETGAAEMIVLPTAMAWESFQELIRTSASLNGHAIRLVPGIRDILATNVRVHQLGLMPLLTLERVRITGLDAILKRTMDCSAALLLAPLALPAIAVAALALSVSGVRPFRTIRMLGREGVPFAAVLLNASPSGTRAQRLIARLGADRLTQLINVLRGEMSIVGPRPVPQDERHRYERWIPNLLTVKPGVTGPWAVHAPPETLDSEMRLSLFYIRNYTIWLDLEIAARSVLRPLLRPAAPGEVVSVGTRQVEERGGVSRPRPL